MSPLISPAPGTRPFFVRRSWLAATVGLLAVVAVAGPSRAVDTSPSSTGTPPGKSWVRIAHLVPGLGAARIDLLPSGGGAATTVQMSPNATYGDVTSYRKMTPGTYEVQVRLSASGSAPQPMLSRALSIEANKAYTLAVLGSATQPRLVTLSDDLTPPSANNARVRVLTAATQAPQVSVMAQDGPTIAENAVLGQASAYTAVPAGTWNLQTTAKGGPQVDSSIKVASGSVYTLLVLNGDAGQPRLDLISDAAGATAAPHGGAQTGGGGTATDLVSDDAISASTVVLIITVLGLLAGAVLLLSSAPGRRVRS